MIKKELQLSEKTASFLANATANPPRSTKRRKLMDQFSLPKECDHAYPPKLDESMFLIVPEPARKEDRLLSKLQQFSTWTHLGLFFLCKNS